MNGVTGYAQRFSRLEAYEEAVECELPAWLPRFWSISRTDALTFGRFLDLYDRETIVLDIGTFVGISAFWFALQPNVSRVVSVDPNPRIADEVLDKEDVNRDFDADYESLEDVRVLNVARAAMRSFEESRKVQLCEGVVGVDQVGIHGASMARATKVEVPRVTDADEISLVAFVDGLHTADGVYADLREIFARSPGAVAFLHDCRTIWGPSVRGGVEAMLRVSGGAYQFELLAPPAPMLGEPNLGIVYPKNSSEEIRHILDQMRDTTVLLWWLLRHELCSPLDCARFAASPRIVRRGAYELDALARRTLSGQRAG